MPATPVGRGTTVKVRGKLFQNLAGQFGKLGQLIDQELSDAGKALVDAQLKANLRHPTGHYQSKITVVNRKDTYMVTDQGVVYGPWLEGTGSRNKTTRFKGYSSFRKATQQLEQAEPHLVQAIVDRFVAELNS